MEDLIRRCFLAMEMTPQGLRSGKTSLDWPFEVNRNWKMCARCHRVIISRTRNLTYVWRISHCFKFIDHTNWSLLQCVQYLISLLIIYFTLVSLANVLFAGMTSLKTVKKHRAVETRWLQPLCTNYFLYTFQRLISGNKKKLTDGKLVKRSSHLVGHHMDKHGADFGVLCKLESLGFQWCYILWTSDFSKPNSLE